MPERASGIHMAELPSNDHRLVDCADGAQWGADMADRPNVHRVKSPPGRTASGMPAVWNW